MREVAVAGSTMPNRPAPRVNLSHGTTNSVSIFWPASACAGVFPHGTDNPVLLRFFPPVLDQLVNVSGQSTDAEL